MIKTDAAEDETSARKLLSEPPPWFMGARFVARAIVICALGLLLSGLGWNFSTRRYLKGFADAIVPLSGSSEEKTEALVEWFRNEPQRLAALPVGSGGLMHDRDPVNIVQNAHLLKVCGSASNAFINLAEAAGLRTRRLLLLGESGGAMHVVTEVQWGDRWVVVNPQQGLVFRDGLGRALTKEELHNPAVFQDAIGRMPGYDPQYTFQNTIHVNLRRLPLVGKYLRSILNRIAPGWEEAFNWGYVPENPPLWLIIFSAPLLALGILLSLMTNRYARKRRVTRLMTSHP
jgi:hypothetical protein